VIEQGPGVVLVDGDGNVVRGTVTVEFYVDQDGYPRLIRPVGDPDPSLGEAAVLNVEEFRFTPPRRNGRRTVVRARMPVILGD